MGISIGANVDKSQDVNSGSLMQIIKMTGSENSVAQTGRMDDNGKDIGKENQFFNVLKEKFALLLQSDQSDNASRLKTSQYMSLLEKLGQDAENLSGDMSSMMAFLNLPVPDDGTILNEEDISDILLSKLISGEMSAGEFMESFNGNGNQVPLTSKENEVITAAGLVEGPNADEQQIFSSSNNLNAQLNGINEIMTTLKSASEADTEECPRSTSLYSGLDSIKDDEVPSNFLRKEAEKNRSAAVSIDQSTFADPRGKETTGLPAEQEDQNVSKSFDEIKFKETSTKDTQISSDIKLGEYLVNKGQQLPESSSAATEKVDQIMSEGQNNVQQTKNIQAEAVTGKSANDHQQNIVLNGLTTSSVQDNNDRLKISADVKTTNENAVTLSEQQILDDRSKKNGSDGDDSHWAGKEQDKTFSDLQRTVAGKANAAVSEYDNLMEKVKTDIKSKTVNAEKNVEGHSLAASEISAATSSKSKDGDISPSQIVNRVTAALNEKMLGDGGRVKITLTPPSLGTLEMDVMVQNSKVRVLLTAENQEVQKILSGNLDLLKGSLQNQGLTIERCDVMMQDRREQYSQGFNQQTFNQDNSHGRQNADNQTFNQNSQTIEKQVVMPNNHHTVWRSGNISIFA